ncbi:GDP-L-galactose phosphorylase 1-like [Tripterygium wilfordii]|uniref:GDP-D-glucose phosphorylase 1 n=1 Tax=Tripterygium wilfordii TaxID=458696 RepID=A0A7J7DUE5_TRIWF|nr:GDP-L-galactose phosphorylase 1-like [Tripterygium wilfordii]KAF5749992.1 GDP-L-galactose phosphorylase 1-like [Tripterygium wilfordii]
MLTIKRVATVLSNYQEENPQTSTVGCGRNCLGKCCLPSSKLPLYAFKNDGKDSTNNGTENLMERQKLTSFLHNLLLGQWEDRRSRGLFLYDVTACDSKIISGKYGFIAQLNEGRHLKKRPTEFRVDQVLQPFDDSKFNFTKVGQEEVLFRFERSNDRESHFYPCMPVTADSSSPNVVAINVSPIEYGHVLLIPRVSECLHQRIDHESFLLALTMAREAADPFFRLGYNSFGAFATINHLHFQAYYLAVRFPVEKAPTQIITRMAGQGQQDRGVIVSNLLDYPVRGLVFEGEGENTTRDLSNAVASSCISLQNNNIPFNVLISDCGNRIFLFPQCYSEKQALGEVNQEILDTHVNPAVWEISGHIVLKQKKNYDDASEAYAWRLLAEASLSETRFREVKALILEALRLEEVDTEETSRSEDEEIICKEPYFESAQHLPQDCMILL